MKDGYIISNNGAVTVVTAGRTYNVSSDHINYDQILRALKVNDYVKVSNLADISNAISDQSEGEVNVVNGDVVYQGKVIHNTVTIRILELMEHDLPFQPMVTFLRNLMLNPSYRAVTELYGFLDGNKLPITEDGFFLAYKRVTEDYLDFHTRTIDNSIGATPSMPRNEVDEDKDITCSNGYHFCSLNYLSQFNKGQGHIMIVKVNPKDVVSIPSDFNNTKGRCSDYAVVGEHVVENDTNDKSVVIPDTFDSPLYDADGASYTGHGAEVDGLGDLTQELGDEPEISLCDGTMNEDCPDCPEHDACHGERSEVIDARPTLGVKPSGQAFHNVRNASGRFTKKTVDVKPTLGVKPSGQAYHNVRNSSGRFTSK